MIGVVARAEEHDVVREFFELFKTPWEFWRGDGRYDVVVDTDQGMSVDRPARLVLLYGSETGAFEDRRAHRPGPPRGPATLSWRGDRIPLYGRCAPLWPDGGSPDLAFEATREPATAVMHTDGRTIVRIGYDLFQEARFLLTEGQPPALAGIPTLERHIALLREWILRSGIPLVEIPAVPAGHRFIACLTHDVDHPAIRLHRFDHTMFGFLYRAVIGSLIGAFEGRILPAALRRNLTAAALLPFVHLGWAKDFWSAFDAYLEIEKGLGSTFFVIPVKNHPGRAAGAGVSGEAPRKRASTYDVSDIAPQLKTALAAGGEVALHGIDAWLDSASGFEERELVSRITGVSTVGARMHWLFWNEGAPLQLEKAGFSYDSTFGYNATVGFRAGTPQAFRPLNTGHLLELPLIIMDTALFYPAYLDLTQQTAREIVWPLVDDVEQYGGALTINWHDRSLAPERLWGTFYAELVHELKRRTAWFPTAAQATEWFRERRSAVFDLVRQEGNSVHVRATVECAGSSPGLTVRVHQPWSVVAGDASRPAWSPRVVDLTLKDSVDGHVRF
jgi:hypothetical protein